MNSAIMSWFAVFSHQIVILSRIGLHLKRFSSNLFHKMERLELNTYSNLSFNFSWTNIPNSKSMLPLLWNFFMIKKFLMMSWLSVGSKRKLNSTKLALSMIVKLKDISENSLFNLLIGSSKYKFFNRNICYIKALMPTTRHKGEYASRVSHCSMFPSNSKVQHKNVQVIRRGGLCFLWESLSFETHYITTSFLIHPLINFISNF